MSNVSIFRIQRQTNCAVCLCTCALPHEWLFRCNFQSSTPLSKKSCSAKQSHCLHTCKCYFIFNRLILHTQSYRHDLCQCLCPRQRCRLNFRHERVISSNQAIILSIQNGQLDDTMLKEECFQILKARRWASNKLCKLCDLSRCLVYCSLRTA